MKKFPRRFRGALLGATLSLAMIGVAGTATFAAASPPISGNPISATSVTTTTTTTTIPQTYHQLLHDYRVAVQAIGTTFKNSVSGALSTYHQSLRAANNSAARATAFQVMEAAIIQAASVRSAALNALGGPPARP